MSLTVPSRLPAWEPVTPPGVAAFARAPLGRLLLVQAVIALLTAATVVWFLSQSWFPVVRAALRQLPAQGRIGGAQLFWSADSPLPLAGNRLLAFAVDLEHQGELGREAQLVVEFGRNDVRVFSLLGYMTIDYPADWSVPFNRTELEPWWGAWEPAILAGAAALTAFGLMVVWTVMATIYCVLVRAITFLGNRDLNWRQSWRLSGAALMPGALLLIVGIICHGLNLTDLIQLGGIACLHLAVGWIYLFVSPLFLPCQPSAGVANDNPFAAGKDMDGPQL
jgi:hypothetical protein